MPAGIVHSFVKFRFVSLFKMVAPAPALGVFLSSCCFLLATCIVFAWFFMTGSNEPIEQPSMVNFEEARRECVLCLPPAPLVVLLPLPTTNAHALLPFTGTWTRR